MNGARAIQMKFLFLIKTYVLVCRLFEVYLAQCSGTVIVGQNYSGNST